MAVELPARLAAVGEWIATFDPASAPGRLDGLLAAQALSVLAATAAGAGDASGQAALAAALALGGQGDIPLPGGDALGLLPALDVLTTWSMVHDYDDYLFMGHTGHSAFWVPLVVGHMLGAAPAEVRAARLIANELGGRLGASLLVGPHNGQLWSPIHRLAAAGATARLLGLDAEQATHALALALYDANDPVFHGFMGTPGKVRTAAGPTTAGVQAAFLAAQGLRGAPDILEHERGFWKRFTFTPLSGTFRGLGDTWVLDTLAIKPFPGCAYVDTAVEAMQQVMRDHEISEGRPLSPWMIDRIVVEAGILTVGMDALSREQVRRGNLTPVVVNFSVPLSLAVTLTQGEVSVDALAADRLVAHREELLEIADHVDVLHDPALSLDLVRVVDRELPVDRWLQAIRWGDLWSLRRRARRELGRTIEREALGRKVDRPMPSGDRAFLRGRLLRPLMAKLVEPLRGHPAADLPFDQVDFRRLRMPFPARVTVIMRDGARRSALCTQPAGAAGEPLLPVAEAKWRREGQRLPGVDIERVLALATDPQASAGELLRAFAGG
jgi:2-methylcitrate dehydratase PrpD